MFLTVSATFKTVTLERSKHFLLSGNMNLQTPLDFKGLEGHNIGVKLLLVLLLSRKHAISRLRVHDLEKPPLNPKPL